ncbi:D-serine dehydratase [Anaerovibrio sp. JC8]|uniref:D-serine ammonia-lyase n=1 Tax=Anaerovibrio sp. JC8 TaxID=1240085 RepID=UPI000A0C36FC|nr:D-serine ammonia-lyase [Anaerovibrio sp. JC8]ORU00660.1 D-serine dehydratase [Anaerovibrio sp. JC8]
MELDSLSSLEKREILFTDIKNAIEVNWINHSKLPNNDAIIRSMLTLSDIDSAEARLRRFAPFIKMAFPETVEAKGMIESPLIEVPELRKALNREKIGANLAGKLYMKMDSELPIGGSVKSRGGIYEVLKYTETLAVENGVLDSFEDDYCKLASPAAKAFFGTKKLHIGSTGNLGLSVGLMGQALGYETIVHMTSEAAEWKKELLRDRGVIVKVYDGDYSEVVAKAKAESVVDANSHFVDDEDSKEMFLGYAVAGKRLKKQLRQQGIVVDKEHPLFVYIPCGVGSTPGGITFGLRQFLGDHVHCFFVEPTQAPCMLLGMVTGLYNNITVQDVGLSGKTHADGLAVGRPSAIIGDFIKPFLSGILTVKDKRLFDYLRILWESEKTFIEPSSCAAIHGPVCWGHSKEMADYLEDNNMNRYMENATHIIWATGGGLVPENVRQELLTKKV